MKTRKKRGSLYRKLVCSYVIFSLLVVALFTFCLVLVSMVVTRGNLSGLVPYLLTDRESCEKAMPGIYNVKGWIEELNKDFRITEVMGEKKTSGNGYTSRELLGLTSPNPGYFPDYVGFLNEKEDGEGYYLVIFGRTEMRLDTTLLYGPENSDTRWEKLFLLLFFSMFGVMCVLMAYYLHRRIRRPLQYLTEGMERVRAGEGEVRLDFQTEAEFAQIRDTFNVMSASLETARREKEESVRKRNRMLLELSHDIRTPLSTINSYALALEMNMVPEEELGKYYKTIRQKADRVNLLAEDLFTMLKMQNSEYELNAAREDVCEFLRRECAEYFADAQKNGLHMEIDIPEGQIWLEADFTLLKRVTDNLLSNAVKYNTAGSMIAVKLYAEQGRVMIEIADDGAPVPEDIRERLFDDFFRGDKARRSDGGTGLGLTIAGAIVRKHGGTLTYRYADGQNRFLAEFACNQDV